MNAEHTKHLIESYPKLYRQKDMPVTESLMCFGFECGDGWFNIIDELSKKIENWNNEHPLEEAIEAIQVKEKFGSLRFYTNGYVDEVQEWISEADDESYKTCEECGKPGAPIPGGWIRTLCPECTRSFPKG